METREIKKDFSQIGGRMLISTIVIMGVQLLCQTIVLGINPAWIGNYDIVLASGMIPMYVIGYPVAFLLMKGKDKRTLEKHSMTVWQVIVAFMMCYGVLIVGNMIGLSITAVIGAVKGDPVSNVLMDVVTSGNLWLTAVYTVILAPVFEEILFRKLICGRLVKYGQGIAIVVSGLMFGLFHGNLNQFFYAFFLGMFLGFIYVKTGNIKYSIVIHMMINFLGSVVGVIVLTCAEESTAGMLISGIYSIGIYAIAITGIVLFIIKRSSMKLNYGEIVIAKKERFKTLFLNLGMILYCVFWIIVMIAQAFIM